MNKRVVGICFILLLSIGLVSASWWGDFWEGLTGNSVTGNAVGDGHWERIVYDDVKDLGRVASSQPEKYERSVTGNEFCENKGMTCSDSECIPKTGYNSAYDGGIITASNKNSYNPPCTSTFYTGWYNSSGWFVSSDSSVYPAESYICCVGGSTSPPPECTPATCTSLGKSCGSWANGTCSGTLNCGICPTGQDCDTATGQCVTTPSTTPPPSCTPATCTSLGKSCGSWANGTCSGTLNCGICPTGQSCSDGTCVVNSFTSCSTHDDCAEGEICAINKCIIDQSYCIDDDDGVDYYEKGTLSARGVAVPMQAIWDSYSYDDYCVLIDEGQLTEVESCTADQNCYINEYSCDPNPDFTDDIMFIIYRDHRCENGCEDGECIETSGSSCTTLTCADYPDQCGSNLDNGCDDGLTLDCSGSCGIAQRCDPSFNCVDCLATETLCDGQDEDCSGVPDDGGICETNICTGCEDWDDCRAEGYVLDNQYCDGSGFVDQLNSGESCSQNYECLSNLCTNGACVDVQEELSGLCSMRNTLVIGPVVRAIITVFNVNCGEFSCIDNDVDDTYPDGLNYYQNSSIIGNMAEGGEFIDYCLGQGENLIERYCGDATHFTEQYDCSSEGKICLDGKCVASDDSPECAELKTLSENMDDGAVCGDAGYNKILDRDKDGDNDFVDLARVVAVFEDNPEQCSDVLNDPVDPCVADGGINEGLIAYYPLDGDYKDVVGGNDVIDHSLQYGNVVAPSNLGFSPSFSEIHEPAPQGISFIYSRGGDLRVPYNPIFKIPTGLTVSIWVYGYPSKSFPYSWIIGYPNKKKQLMEYGLYINSNGRIASRIDGVLRQTTYANRIKDLTEKWHQIVLTVDAEHTRHYVDGVLVGEYPGDAEIIYDSDEDIIIKPFGSIDEIKIWTRTLSSDEVGDLYVYNSPEWINYEEIGRGSFAVNDYFFDIQKDRNGPLRDITCDFVCNRFEKTCLESGCPGGLGGGVVKAYSSNSLYGEEGNYGGVLWKHYSCDKNLTYERIFEVYPGADYKFCCCV